MFTGLGPKSDWATIDLLYLAQKCGLVKAVLKATGNVGIHPSPKEDPNLSRPKALHSETNPGTFCVDEAQRIASLIFLHATH